MMIPLLVFEDAPFLIAVFAGGAFIGAEDDRFCIFSEQPKINRSKKSTGNILL